MWCLSGVDRPTFPGRIVVVDGWAKSDQQWATTQLSVPAEALWNSVQIRHKQLDHPRLCREKKLCLLCIVKINIC